MTPSWLSERVPPGVNAPEEDMRMLGNQDLIYESLLELAPTPKRLLHGLSKTPEYGIWTGIIKRCENERHRSYKDYGGRGISIFSGWRYNFPAFLEHVGQRPTAHHSIDRIDNDRGYEPGNVRWSTRNIQARNTRHCRRVTANGETLSLVEWSERGGFSYRTMLRRIRDGWPEGQAVTETPRLNLRLVEWRGESLSIAEWSTRTGLSRYSIAHRLNVGWTVDKALTMSKQQSVSFHGLSPERRSEIGRMGAEAKKRRTIEPAAPPAEQLELPA